MVRMDMLTRGAGNGDSRDDHGHGRNRRTRRLTAVLIFTASAVAGLAWLAAGSAAQYAVSLEAEHGQRSGAAADGPVQGASAGASVRFGAAAPGSIIFEDDFNGPAGALPDQSKWGDWSTETYNGSAAYGLIKPGNNETLDGAGHLVIPATPTAGSAVTTGDRFKFTYGTMSAWIKLPAEVGYWPAFWTLNNNANGQDILPLGEIDVLEGYTTWNNVYHAVGHNWTGNDATNSHSPDNYCPNDWQARDVDLTAGYHKYSAKVEPNKITYYFDDEQCGLPFTKESNPGKPWGFGPDVMRGNWLILNVAIGGAGGQQQPAVQPTRMLVDRVEVRSPQ